MIRANVQILIDREWSYCVNWWLRGDALTLQQRIEYCHGVPARLVPYQ